MGTPVDRTSTPVLNRSAPKIEPDRAFVHMGPAIRFMKPLRS